MAISRSVWKRVRGFLALGLGLSGIALAISIYLHEQTTPIRVIRLTAGSSQSMRHQLALALGEEAKSEGLQISIRVTDGSEESLDEVNSGTIDVALVQGGLNFASRPNVRQVATLNVEPLHLLVKPELQVSVEESLLALRGKTINLSRSRSGTNLLARDVLEFAGLKQEGVDYHANTLGYQELEAMTSLEQLPDAAFVISAPPAPIAQHLVSKWGYRLVPLPFAAVFQPVNVEPVFTSVPLLVAKVRSTP